MTLLLPFANEATEVHTRILRLSLAVEESRAYFRHVDPRVPLDARSTIAISEGWWPGRSEARVRYLVAACAERFDAFPDGLEALRRWSTLDDACARVVCHVHLMLSDPLYRAFHAELFALKRRGGPLDRDIAARWVETKAPGRWAGVTAKQAAQKLLAATHEAGLVTAKDPREQVEMQVPDLALAYVLQLLRGVRHGGSALANAYLASMGFAPGDAALRQRLASMGPLGVRVKSGEEPIFADPDVVAWARHTFAPRVA
jgi:hypothetical protein